MGPLVTTAQVLLVLEQGRPVIMETLISVFVMLTTITWLMELARKVRDEIKNICKSSFSLTYHIEIDIN